MLPTASQLNDEDEEDDDVEEDASPKFGTRKGEQERKE